MSNEHIVEEVEDVLEEISSWDELDVPTDLLRGVYAMGFEKPSPIQSKAVAPIISGRDVLAQAQSGTGKTATFTIGALARVTLTDNFTQVLVLTPTRELCSQITSVFKGIGVMLEGLRVKTVVGGNSIDEDIRELKNEPPHVIVGCSGRVQDMMNRGYISYKTIKLLIIDEADEMLSIGFKDQVYEIFQYLNTDIQVALFSATLPEYIRVMTGKFMRNPIRIYVKSEQLTLEGISQYFVAVEDDRQKYATLKELYGFMSLSQCIIYCNSVKRVVELYEAMLEDGFPVCCMHSSMDKRAREEAFSEFRCGKYRVLISSNVTSRGIDIQQVSTVINFDIPKSIENYLHRIGRSGRWGRKGVGINFITRRDVSKLKEIETHYSCQINELPANFETLAR